MVTWDARTQQTSRRTRVRRGEARGSPLLARRTASSFFILFYFIFFFRFAIRVDLHRLGADASWFVPNWADSLRLGPNQPNIGVFRPEKENWPVRKKKKKKLKPKIPRRYRRHNLTPFFFFFFLFFAGGQRTFYSVLFLLVDKFCFCFLKRIVKCLC